MSGPVKVGHPCIYRIGGITAPGVGPGRGKIFFLPSKNIGKVRAGPPAGRLRPKSRILLPFLDPDVFSKPRACLLENVQDLATMDGGFLLTSQNRVNR